VRHTSVEHALESLARLRGHTDFDFAFLQDTLEVKCDVKDPQGCSEKETKFIDAMKAKTSEDRTKELTRLSSMKVRSLKFHRTLNLLKSIFAGWVDEARIEAVASAAPEYLEATGSLSEDGFWLESFAALNFFELESTSGVLCLAASLNRGPNAWAQLCRRVGPMCESAERHDKDNSRNPHPTRRKT
jgi:hypothetical protein